MSDIDRVFARLGGRQIAGGDQRELRRIPRKGGASARVVEVVRLPPKGAAASASGPRRNDTRVRAESWEDGFPTRPIPPPAWPQQSAAAPAPEPVTHLMPMWEPATKDAPAAAAAPAPVAAQPHPTDPPAGTRATPRATLPARRVADPFDASDDAANCLRCGYVVEPRRERRGLMTCAACG